jgi:hypothetical protein
LAFGAGQAVKAASSAGEVSGEFMVRLCWGHDRELHRHGDQARGGVDLRPIHWREPRNHDRSLMLCPLDRMTTLPPFERGGLLFKNGREANSVRSSLLNDAET